MEQELTEQKKALLEYRRRIRTGEFVEPEKLKGKRVEDVLKMPEFINVLTSFIDEQMEMRKQVLRTIEELKNEGKRVAEKRPTIDRVIELGLMENPGDFAVEFARVMDKESKHPRDIRDYIRQLGMKAYITTIDQLIVAANVDLAELKKQATTTTKN